MELKHLTDAKNGAAENFTTTRISTLLQKHLLAQRKVFLWGPVEDSSAKEIVEQLVYLADARPDEPIHFFINSPGGVVTSGYAIYDIITSIDTPVYTYCIGYAASMGSILLSGGAKGHRYIYPLAEVMIHQPGMGGFRGGAAEIEIQAKQIRKAKEIAARILAENCGHTVDKIKHDFDRDRWMDAEESVAYGIVDKILD
ncbi:MAG TPA: ATP-dependent Clp protease proteolytic subunit [Chitinophagales bacterium]|nr:ATP-dependent Clp protease proteolytic subunit [Chitinophagales bacterium]